MLTSPYPYLSYLVNKHRTLGGQQTGILEGYMISTTYSRQDPYVHTITGKMPSYHKSVLDPDAVIQYHLSGYGSYYEESLIRYMGEGLERYALMVGAQLYEDQLVFASHRQLEQSGEDVMPFDYIRLFADDDYKRLERLPPLHITKPTEDSVFGWLHCASITNPGHQVWMPAQLLFVGYKVHRERGEQRFAPGFSTGTAAHATLADALVSALTEWAEIDAFSTRWYAKLSAPEVVIDDLLVAHHLQGILGHEKTYVPIVTYLTLPDLPVHAFGVFLRRNEQEIPHLLYGAQGHLNPRRGVYRGFMEALAIGYLGIYGCLFMPAQYLVDPEQTAFTDLDTNVAYYAHPTRVEEKNRLIRDLVKGQVSLSSLPDLATGKAETDLAYLVKHLAKLSSHGVYLDITPPEAADQGFKVIRTYLPELCTMCMPGYPYTRHPRLLQYGGVRNEFPHPLP